MAEARDPPADRQRIDKWLWHARLARTRTLAQDLATSGRVRVNRERSESSSRAVKTGDVLTIALAGGIVRVLRVKAFAERRGSATDAARLYDDLAPPVPRAASAPADPPALDPGHRPNKHERRDRLAFERSDEDGSD